MEPTVGFDAEQLAGRFIERLSAAGNPVRAERERAYLKSSRPFLGVDVPTTRRITRGLVCTPPTPLVAVSLEVVRLLWARPEFDARRAAAEVLCAVARRGELDRGALAWLEPMLADGETWAIVDTISVGVSGAILDADRSGATDAVMRVWARSPELWVRRASLLSLLPSLRRDLDRWPLFVELADLLMDEREFFIRKAIGWVARDVGRRAPEVVHEWAVPRLDAMSGVTRREVVRHLPELRRLR